MQFDAKRAPIAANDDAAPAHARRCEVDLVHALAARHPQLLIGWRVWLNAAMSDECRLPTLAGLAALRARPHGCFVNEVRRRRDGGYEIRGGDPGAPSLRRIGRIVHPPDRMAFDRTFRDEDAALEWIAIDDGDRRDRYWRLSLPARETERSPDADVLLCVIGLET